MEYIASYPLTEDIITPHIGKTVIGVTRMGDPFCGIVHACSDGHLHLTPLHQGTAVPPATIKAVKKQRSTQLKTKQRSSKVKMLPKVSRQSLEKANVSLVGYGGYGRGFGVAPGFGFGLGAGVGFALPLLAIGALFAAAFFI